MISNIAILFLPSTQTRDIDIATLAYINDRVTNVLYFVKVYSRHDTTRKLLLNANNAKRFERSSISCCDAVNNWQF